MPAYHIPLLTARQYWLNRMIWLAILLCAGVDAVWMGFSGITVDYSNITPFFISISICFLLSFIYGYVRRNEGIWLLVQVASQILISTPVLGGMSYLAARANLPLIDNGLIAADRLAGFSWKDYIGWLNKHPLLSDILSIAYVSAGPEMLVVLLLLYAYKNTLQIQRFTLVFILGSLVTIIIASLLPSVGGYIYYNINLSDYPNLHPAAARVHEGVLLGMRDHSIRVFQFPIRGIVSFPSFHTSTALLLIYAAWPFKRLRPFCIAINLIIIWSVMGDGGHYLADVVGGTIIALLAIAASEKWIRA